MRIHGDNQREELYFLKLLNRLSYLFLEMQIFFSLKGQTFISEQSHMKKKCKELGRLAQQLRGWTALQRTPVPVPAPTLSPRGANSLPDLPGHQECAWCTHIHAIKPHTHINTHACSQTTHAHKMNENVKLNKK